jgi:hypothetical protein
MPKGAGSFDPLVKKIGKAYNKQKFAFYKNDSCKMKVPGPGRKAEVRMGKTWGFQKNRWGWML